MDGNFRNNVEKLLREKRMTQRELASKLGVSEVTVSRWLTAGDNGRNPSVKTLQKVAEILDTTPDYLLGNGEQKSEEKSKDDSVDWGKIFAGAALTATAVIAIVALAKATGKLTENDNETIKDILNK